MRIRNIRTHTEIIYIDIVFFHISYTNKIEVKKINIYTPCVISPLAMELRVCEGLTSVQITFPQ